MLFYGHLVQKMLQYEYGKKNMFRSKCMKGIKKKSRGKTCERGEMPQKLTKNMWPIRGVKVTHVSEDFMYNRVL
jgi:hypothetical protein